ncbi:MAG: hypothetical protein QOD86_1584 [Miltoncostaeaceae bacterium]|jgi:hypothetical protein|nr:hypothetical protein [Miltoncostaeaceae bacterium]
MSPAAARRLAWSLWAVAVALAVAGLVLAIVDGDAGESGGGAGLAIVLAVPVVVLPTIGALVASRRPGHPVGWILIGGGVLLVLSTFTESYGVHALYGDPGSLPAGRVAAVISASIFVVPLFTMPALLFLLFPDGRLASRRWRLVVWLAGISSAAVAVDAALFSDRLDDAPFDGVANPLALEVPGWVGAISGFIGWPVMAVSVVLAAAGMIMRLRRARGQQRQQLKWMAAAAGLFAVAAFSSVAAFYAGAESLGGVVLVIGWCAIPLAAGAAILRHRIYDIDLVINRALVYGSLTALLAGAYVGLALLLSLALEPLTSGSDLAIALSTLGVAALVRPVRRRVQALVDRRFYRRKYDAERTLARFAARLGAETDLDALRGVLTAAIHETVQPAHVSLWLREPAR